MIVTYKLAQQTPMIHFQSREDGATLRGSEVKPKLDRFLIEQLGGEKNARDQHPGWFISKEHPALKYKLRFTVTGDPRIEEPHKLYFGNMGVDKTDDKRMTVFYPNGVALELVCFEADLDAEIRRYLPCFFALYAFGTRSGKGFGCFATADLPVDAELLKSCCPLGTYYSITYRAKKSHTSLLNDIWVISGMMKSGFNFTFRNPNDYYKGHIFKYFTKKGIGGDKAFIKQKVLTQGNDNNENSEEKARYAEFRFVRAMLGLPGGFEFRNGQKTRRRGKVEVTSNDIERFQSPIHFRIQGDKLLIIPQKIPSEMNDAAFSLNNKIIRTPPDFSLIDFLDSFADTFNRREVISKFQSQDVRNSIITETALKIEKIGGAQQ